MIDDREEMEERQRKLSLHSPQKFVEHRESLHERWTYAIQQWTEAGGSWREVPAVIAALLLSLVFRAWENIAGVVLSSIIVWWAIAHRMEHGTAWMWIEIVLALFPQTPLLFFIFGSAWQILKEPWLPATDWDTEWLERHEREFTAIFQFWNPALLGLLVVVLMFVILMGFR